MPLFDKTDRAILKILAENARMPIKEIAKHVFLSAPATTARIAKLEQNGYILQYTTMLDYTKLGYPIKAIIHIKMDRTDRDKLYPYIQQCSNVVECSFISGDYCMMLTVLFKTTGELDKFVDMIQKNGGETQTQIVFSTPIERRSVTE